MATLDGCELSSPCNFASPQTNCAFFVYGSKPHNSKGKSIVFTDVYRYNAETEITVLVCNAECAVVIPGVKHCLLYSKDAVHYSVLKMNETARK